MANVYIYIYYNNITFLLYPVLLIWPNDTAKSMGKFVSLIVCQTKAAIFNDVINIYSIQTILPILHEATKSQIAQDPGYNYATFIHLISHELQIYIMYM